MNTPTNPTNPHIEPSAQAQPATVFITPIRPAIPTTGGTLEVLVRVQAPAQPDDKQSEGSAANRAPLRLALVVDRSGSMDGEPLDEALRCVEHIAGRLAPRDELAVVLYDDQVQVPLPLAAGGDPARLRAALEGVRSGGSTDLHAGWLAGARQLEAGGRLRAATADEGAGTAGNGEHSLSRVILLSDGQANAGLLDPVRIEQQCAHWLAQGVSTTTVGLGRGFNEDLMLGMARAGGGQQYYGQTAADLVDGFDEELALLQAMVLRGLRLNLVPGPGVVAEALGQVHRLGDGQYVLSDLAWAAESWLMVRLHVGALTSNDPGKAAHPLHDQHRALLSVTLQAEDMLGASRTLHSPVLSLPVLDASACKDLSSDPVVAQRLQELQFGDAAAEVRTLLLAGDTLAARRKLKLMEPTVADHPWLRDKLARLRELTERDAAMSVKELRFSVKRMSSRLASTAQFQYSDLEVQDDAIPAYLRRKGAEGQGRGGNNNPRSKF
ncbi:MAG: VWA domain-containing protein [Rhodoferax sp.]|nr:VWA domain-containing protein [Rhodoferax sp.]